MNKYKNFLGFLLGLNATHFPNDAPSQEDLQRMVSPPCSPSPLRPLRKTPSPLPSTSAARKAANPSTPNLRTVPLFTNYRTGRPTAFPPHPIHYRLRRILPNNPIPLDATLAQFKLTTFPGNETLLQHPPAQQPAVPNAPPEAPILALAEHLKTLSAKDFLSGNFNPTQFHMPGRGTPGLPNNSHLATPLWQRTPTNYPSSSTSPPGSAVRSKAQATKIRTFRSHSGKPPSTSSTKSSPAPTCRKNIGNPHNQRNEAGQLQFFMKTYLPALLVALLPLFAQAKPNIVFILADDLGYADIGAFGQKTLQTPRLDKMAGEGMILTQFYSGSTVCAPSRSVLMTGKHTGHTAVRGNSTEPIVIQPGDTTVASLLKKAGYATGCIGKWGISTPDNFTNPNDVGFDHFYGYINMWHAHNFYPEFLIRNGQVEKLDNEVSEKWKPYQDQAPQLGAAGWRSNATNTPRRLRS